MGDTSPNHNSNYSYRNPTFYYIGTLDPSGIWGGQQKRRYTVAFVEIGVKDASGTRKNS